MHEYLGRPFVQLAAFTLLSLLIILLLRPKDANSVYTIAGIIYVMFILTNSLYIAFVPSVWPYFFYSMLFSIVYLLTISMIAPLYMNVAKIDDGSAESAGIFLVIIYHPFASLLVIFLKWGYMKLF